CTDIFNSPNSDNRTIIDFYVPETPPTNLYPTGDKLRSLPPYEFSFGQVPNPYAGSPYNQPFQYIALIDDDNDFSSPIGGERSTYDSTLVVNDVFEAGKIYYWRIWAKNKPGTEAPWAESSFEIEPSLTVSDVAVSPTSGSSGDSLTISWNSTAQNHWFIYQYDSTGANPINTSFGLSANCIDAGSDGSDGCLDQANPSTATSTAWTIPSHINGEFTIKVKVWDSQGQPPEGVGAVSNSFGVCEAGSPPGEPNDVLARTLETSTVYWIKYGKKWLFTGSPDAPPEGPDKAQDHFYKLGYTDSQVVRYCSDVLDSLPQGKNILGNDVNFVYRKQDPSTVYIIRNGVSDWFFNWQTFLNSDFGTEDVYWATDAGFGWIQSIYQPGQLIGLKPEIRISPEKLIFN
ncbi:MAG: hypothetical protein GY869_24565, partial [Planctomycetes bacterium]|nr:hypothetical protein [Planctomycetota bacterium]